MNDPKRRRWKQFYLRHCYSCLGSYKLSCGIAVNDGSIVGAEIDGHDASINAAGIRAIAELVNPDAACNGSDYTSIILDAERRELGCASCPWRDECEAMFDDD